MTGLKNIVRSMKGNRSLYSSLLLQTVIILLYISTISGESEAMQANKNRVTTEQDCKKYLCKYGYLNCDCGEYLERRKRELIDGIILSEYSNTSPPSSDATQLSHNQFSTLPVLSKQPCSAENFTNAFKTFQLNYRLNVTGICDERTASQMSLRRCGQPDSVIDKLDVDLAEKEVSSRQARSLTEIINSNAAIEESIKRRKEQLMAYQKEIEEESVTPKPTGAAREKRSIYTNVNDYGTLLSKQRISWRLMSDHLYHIIPPSNQRSILRQAFRYWSEVTPLCFYEELNNEQRVDIEIGFLEGIHLSCYRQFDGYGGEIAHKFHRDVHFDNSEPYTIHLSSPDRISLLLVAVHELGHVIGLNHSDVDTSVMNAIYHRKLRGDFELDPHDRREVRRAYGSCHGRFDTAFDYVRTKPGTKNSRIFNTYFFRGDHYWRYENNMNKTRSGDPMLINSQWSGVPENVDTFLHYWEFDVATMTFADEYLFFKGSRIFSYDPISDSAVAVSEIRNKFISYNSTTHIPNNLDAAFFDQRSAVGLVYFFKDNMVYSYKYRVSGSHSCCTSIEPIVSLFPPSTQSDLYSPNGNTYQTNLDLIYLSNSQRAVYFIKGNDTWVNEDYFNTAKSNSMKYVGHWYDVWQFICDGECL
ncbi:matrix metalloproteinase-21-like [Watersipora subatra]|uniref:matrix metalloproteinase-21-like n=1 Tax=Watersipora subatra TaxID=2589382 RepID=UPI00355BACBC